MTDLRISAAFFLSLFALTLHAAEPAGNGTHVIEYTIQPGDTISNLSERYLDGRARWGAIVKLNPGLDIHKLRPGQTLYLPESRIRSVGKTAKVLKINGQAQSDGANLQEGQQLAAGTYFVRVRATTSDGIEGPYSSGQKFVVPEEESGFPTWILLFFLPLLAL
jgi:murein DD-endopeptidase MepM/ murein hydrolase activator NlpD